jgi:hypothetical protein
MGPERFRDQPPPPQEAQQAFMERLAEHHAQLTGPLPDLSGVLDRKGRLPSEREAGRFLGVHLSKETLTPFRDHGERGPEAISFTHNELLEIGHDESYHDAFIGRLRMASADGAVVDERTVVVKPFFMHEAGSAVQELAMLQRVREAGFRTVTPLGVVLDDRWDADPQRLFLITAYEGELSTMAAENWRRLNREDVAGRVKPALDTMLSLHEKGLMHGDPQFKNVASGETEGSSIIHDLEEARDVTGLLAAVEADDPVPLQLVQLLKQEFWRVRLSMRKYVYPNLPRDQRPTTPEERFMFELDTVFEPYHRALSESAMLHRNTFNRAYTAVLEMTRAEIAEGREPNLHDAVQS